MTVRRIPRAGLLLLGALLAAGLLLAQAPARQPLPEEKKQDKKEEKPRKRVFTGKISLRSSRQEKETASYGFKGVGPDGRMEQAALNAQPGEMDVIKVARLAINDARPEELAAFLAEGNLRTKEKKP